MKHFYFIMVPLRQKVLKYGIPKPKVYMGPRFKDNCCKHLGPYGSA